MSFLYGTAGILRDRLSFGLDGLRTLTFVVGTSMAVGVASSITGSQVRAWFAIMALAIIPGLLVVASLSPATAAFVLVFGQIFEAFEFDVQVFTFSVGIAALFAFLVTRLNARDASVLTSGGIFLLIHILAIYVLSRGLLLLNGDSDSALRSLVTALSFAMLWFAGALAGTRDGRRGMALGATAALLLLGLLGIMASSGLIPTPDRITASRDILGIVSPFQRNYGLNNGFVSVAVLAPLATPWLLWQVFKSGDFGVRCGACALLLLILLSSLLVFQSRSMVIEQVLAWVMALMLFRASFVLRALLPLMLIACAIVAVPQLLETDQISSDLRSSSYDSSIRIIKENPRILLLGSNRSETLQTIESESKWGFLVPEAPIHNVFLMETIVGGIAASGSLALLFAVPLFAALRLLSKAGRSHEHGSLIILMAAMLLVEVIVNPAEANIAGLWLALGAMARLAFDKSLLGQIAEKPPVSTSSAQQAQGATSS